MAKRKPTLPDYGTVQIKGNTYFRTRVSDDEGNRFSLYAATREELYEKVLEVEKQIENKTFRRNTPTVREYCEKWLLNEICQHSRDHHDRLSVQGEEPHYRASWRYENGRRNGG